MDKIVRLPDDARRLIAIAGPPASGKSTLAAALVNGLNASGGPAVLVPMDGFHLDNNILSEQGLLTRKGSPESFDALGFVNAISRLRTEPDVILPAFDRARDISIAGAVKVTANHRVVVVEGNYLFFNAAPWHHLDGMWDLSVYLNVPHDVLVERLVQRWLDLGLTRQEALEKARMNDLPNAERVAASRMPMDFVIDHGH